MEQALESYIFKHSRLGYPAAWGSEVSMWRGAVHEVVFKGVTGSGPAVHLHGLEKDFDRRDVRGL